MHYDASVSRCVHHHDARSAGNQRNNSSGLWQRDHGFNEWLHADNFMLLKKVRAVFKAAQEVANHIDSVSGYPVVRIKVFIASYKKVSHLWQAGKLGIGTAIGLNRTFMSFVTRPILGLGTEFVFIAKEVLTEWLYS